MLTNGKNAEEIYSCFCLSGSISTSDRRLTTNCKPGRDSIVRGHVVSDVMELELGRWERMGAAGCYLNLANQQQTNVYVCEIRPGSQTLPQRHLFEEIIYIVKGRGATSVWQEGTSKVTFEWGPGAVFAIPLNSSYQHFNGSRDEPVRLFAGTTCPRMINIFHNEDFIFRNPFNFRDRFHDGQEFLRFNKHMADRYRETNLAPDVINSASMIFHEGKGSTCATPWRTSPTVVTFRNFRRGPEDFSPPWSRSRDHYHPG